MSFREYRAYISTVFLCVLTTVDVRPLLFRFIKTSMASPSHRLQVQFTPSVYAYNFMKKMAVTECGLCSFKTSYDAFEDELNDFLHTDHDVFISQVIL